MRLILLLIGLSMSGGTVYFSYKYLEFLIAIVTWSGILVALFAYGSKQIVPPVSRR